MVKSAVGSKVRNDETCKCVKPKDSIGVIKICEVEKLLSFGQTTFTD